MVPGRPVTSAIPATHAHPSALRRPSPVAAPALQSARKHRPKPPRPTAEAITAASNTSHSKGLVRSRPGNGISHRLVISYLGVTKWRRIRDKEVQDIKEVSRRLLTVTNGQPSALITASWGRRSENKQLAIRGTLQNVTVRRSLRVAKKLMLTNG